ncbi:cyclin-like protein [Phakopsora pachyrhizi]|uniref:Cyclin-like protein n=1 Tax=Phakopsora pachyrhizi TaxID=170000 RepID=A0AAV0BG27_PHAPC|nr:cyclin-like protein [Phakopsora pachyrhizi]
MSSVTQVLLNPLAEPDQPTPSSSDQIPSELESELRLYGGLLIQQAGIRLKLPQVVMATAATLFQRFYFVTSFLNFVQDVSAGSLFLAAKLEEKPVRLRDIINVYDYLLKLIRWSREQLTSKLRGSDAEGSVKSLEDSEALRVARSRIESNPLLPASIKANMLRNLEKTVKSDGGSKLSSSDPDRRLIEDDEEALNVNNRLDLQRFRYEPMSYNSQTFYDRKEEIVVAEMQILKRLGFRVQVQHPYSAMVNYLRVLNLTGNEHVPQRAWGYLNDFLLTPLPALYPPTHLATLSIYLATRELNLRLPEAWWELFDVSDESELEEMSRIIKGIYPTRKPRVVDDDDNKTSPEVKDGERNGSEKDDDGNELSEDDMIWIRVSRLPVTKEGLREFVEEVLRGKA